MWRRLRGEGGFASRAEKPVLNTSWSVFAPAVGTEPPGQGGSGDLGRLAAGLLRRAAARGARIYSPVEVLQAVSDPDGVMLLTGSGRAVRAIGDGLLLRL